jgi:hypothetical protein
MGCGRPQELADRDVVPCLLSRHLQLFSSSRPQSLVPGLSLVVHISYVDEAAGNGGNYLKKNVARFQVFTAASMKMYSGMMRHAVWKNWLTLQRCVLLPSSGRWVSRARKCWLRYRSRSDMAEANPHDGDSKYLRNSDQFLSDYSTQHPRRRSSSRVACTFHLYGQWN